MVAKLGKQGNNVIKDLLIVKVCYMLIETLNFKVYDTHKPLNYGENLTHMDACTL